MKPNQVNETLLEIDLNALEHNYGFLRSLIHKNTLFLGVVKAFAYGSDAIAIAKKLEDLGVNYFAVAYTKEGVTLRKGGITTPILVLHPQSVHFETLIENNLTPSIYSNFVLDAFINKTQEKKLQAYPIHLKLNTGLNRLGFDEPELENIAHKINQSKSIRVEGAFSHLAASEDLSEKAFTLQQIEKFTQMCALLEQKLTTPFLKHLCNTSGIINYPEAHFDMVRSGIGLHGYGNTPEIDKQLIPTATLKTIISQIHTINKGESVSYNRKFFAPKTMRTATLPLGHADGLNRIYGLEKTNVLIHNKLAPIIGNVCMDMVMVDVTDIPCEEGDEVIVFGKGKSAESFANNAGTISYELITSVSQRVKRKIIY